MFNVQQPFRLLVTQQSWSRGRTYKGRGLQHKGAHEGLIEGIETAVRIIGKRVAALRADGRTADGCTKLDAAADLERLEGELRSLLSNHQCKRRG